MPIRCGPGEEHAIDHEADQARGDSHGNLAPASGRPQQGSPIGDQRIWNLRRRADGQERQCEAGERNRKQSKPYQPSEAALKKRVHVAQRTRQTRFMGISGKRCGLDRCGQT